MVSVPILRRDPTAPVPVRDPLGDLFGLLLQYTSYEYCTVPVQYLYCTGTGMRSLICSVRAPAPSFIFFASFISPHSMHVTMITYSMYGNGTWYLATGYVHSSPSLARSIPPMPTSRTYICQTVAPERKFR